MLEACIGIWTIILAFLKVLNFIEISWWVILGPAVVFYLIIVFLITFALFVRDN